MGAYFKPLRRKIGVTMLVATCVLVAGWIRSRHVCDRVALANGERSYHQLFSGANSIGWVMVPCTNGTIPNWYQTSAYGWRISYLDHQTGEASLYSMVHRRMELKGAGYVWAYSEDANLHFIIPYWSVVLPLTVLSAWLLLSKPRGTTPPPLPGRSPRFDVELNNALGDSFSVRVSSPTYCRVTPDGYTDTLVKWAIDAIPDTTFVHLRTVEVCYGQDADETETFYQVSNSRPNVLALLACKLQWSEPAYALAMRHSIPVLEVEAVRKQMIDAHRDPYWPPLFLSGE